MKSTITRVLSVSVVTLAFIACSGQGAAKHSGQNDGFNRLQDEPSQVPTGQNQQQVLVDQKARLNEALAEIAQLTKERDEAVASGAMTMQQAKDLQAKLDDAEKSARTAIDVIQKQLNDANAQVTDLTEQVKIAITNGFASAQQISDLQAKLDDAKNDALNSLALLQTQLDEANARISDLTKQVSDSVSQKASDAQSVKDLQIKLDASEKAAREAIDALQLRLNDANDKMATLSLELKDALASGAASAQQAKDLQIKLDEADKTSRAALDALQIQVNDSSDKVAKLTVQLAAAVASDEAHAKLAMELQAKLDDAEKAARDAIGVLQGQLSDANEKVSKLVQQVSDSVEQGNKESIDLRAQLDVAQQEVSKILDALDTKDPAHFIDLLSKAEQVAQDAKTKQEMHTQAVTAKGEELRSRTETLMAAKSMTLAIEGDRSGEVAKIGLREAAAIAAKAAFDANLLYTDSVIEFGLRSKVHEDLTVQCEKVASKACLKNRDALPIAAKAMDDARLARDAAYAKWMELDGAAQRADLALNKAISERSAFLEQYDLDLVRQDLIVLESQRDDLLVVQKDAESLYSKAAAKVTCLKSIITMVESSKEIEQADSHQAVSQTSQTSQTI